MTLTRIFFVVMVAVSLTAGAYGCKQKGTAERVGKKIDNAIEKAKDKLDDVTK